MFNVLCKNNMKSASKERKRKEKKKEKKAIKKFLFCFIKKNEKRKDKHMYIWNSGDFMQKASENEQTNKYKLF